MTSEREGLKMLRRAQKFILFIQQILGHANSSVDRVSSFRAELA
jgi:hypothetical protein